MQPRTSDTDPILVNFLPPGVVSLPGKLGVTFAPGKQHFSLHRILWERSLEKDLTRLRDFYHTDLLVSLIEAHELTDLKIPDLFDQVKSHDIQSLWFPIPDFSIPMSMPGFMTLVETILKALHQEQTVVVHCKGGLGRSGLVTSGCLVALGYSPAESFHYIRQTRPGSVETREQEAYVYQFAQQWKVA